MLLDADKGCGRTLPHYDLCIVGAGAAGISLALQLLASGLKVCLLEAGGLRYEKMTQQLFEGATQAVNYPSLRDTRLGAFGGTSNVWAGWCRPLETLDFEPRDWCSAIGWPFGLEQLQPYYERAHAICGLGAMEYRPEYWQHLLGEQELLQGDSGFVKRIFHVLAQNFGFHYYQAIRDSKNVDLVLHAPVVRIGMDSGTHKATHVDVRTLESFEMTIGAEHFVLAAGGIENARLLLLSAESAAGAPGNERGLVGRFFSDHPFVDPGSLILRHAPKSMPFFRPQPVAAAVSAASVRGVLSLSRAFLERERLMNGALFFYPRYESHAAFESDEVKALLQLWAKFSNHAVPGDVGPLFMRAVRAPHLLAVALARKLLVRDGPAMRWRMRIMFETEFRHENRVTLGDEQDHLGRRQPRVEWHLSDYDVHNMRRVTANFDQAVRDAGIGHLERAFADDPAAWRRSAEGGKHHMGTTRMHVDPRYGVVDENGRVHSTANLYITGSSVFPSGGYANPTLTIVALAVRLGDHLKTVIDA